MDWNNVEKNWDQFKHEVKEQWDKLTDDDLEEIKGNRAHLASRLEKEYSKSPEVIDREIMAWTHRR